jgi:hypothetical protein
MNEVTVDLFCTIAFPSRVTGRLCENIAQNVAQLIFGRNLNITFTLEKSGLKFFETFVIF